MAAYDGEVLNEKPEQVSGAVTPPAIDFETDYKNKAEKLKAEYDKKVKELTTSTLKVGGETYEIPSALTSTPVVAAATVVGLYGAKKAGEYLYDKTASALDGIKNRMINKAPDVTAPSPISQQPVTEKPKSTFAQQFETTYGVPLSKAEELTGGPITNPKDAAIVGGALKNQAGISVNNPYQLSPYTQPTTGPFFNPVAPAAPQATAPVAPVAPTDPLAPRPNPYMTPSVQESVATGNTAQAVQTVVAKEIDKATGVAPTLATFNRDANGNIDYPKGMSSAAKQGAEAFAQQYPEQAKSLAAEGRFGILGAGSGDNNLFNSYGSDMMKRIRNEINEGQMVGPYANYETKVNPAIKAISPETAIGKDLAQLREAQIGGNYGPLGTPATIGGKKGGMITGPNTVPKAIKAGGPALLLMSIADAAKAAQQGNYGEAAMRSADVATDYLPMISQLKQGLAPREAGAPTVSQQRIESSALLGSPYAQTEWAKNQRLKEKAGAGRGIAPPSAYMR
jgi:hypothetical protein